MKLSIFSCTLLSSLFPGAAAASAIKGRRSLRNNQNQGHHPADSRQLNGGKKAGCTDGATVIASCNYMIPGPGRYILEDDLNCGPGESGIIIMDVDDVHIDCQDNKIVGDKEDPGELGIGVAGDHITIANCKVRKFVFGVFANGFDSADVWTDLTIQGSTFNNHAQDGAFLSGNEEGTISTVTITDSNFNGNSDDGMTCFDVSGVIISSTFSNNFDNGVVLNPNNRDEEEAPFTLIGLTADKNGDAGLVTFPETVTSVVASRFCNNAQIEDNFLAIQIGGDFAPSTSGINFIAQATTCDFSFPINSLINGLPICQCPCNGGGSESKEESIIVGDASDGTAAITAPKLTVEEKLEMERNEAIVIANNITVASIVADLGL